MSDEAEGFSKELLRSLPPMERRDLETVVEHVRKFDRTLDAASFWKEHAVRTCSGTIGETAETSSNSSDCQIEHIRTKLSNYQSRYTAKGVTARCSVVQEQAAEDGSTVIVARTYAEHLDAGNCSAGSWAAVWTIRILTEKEAELQGTVQLHTHYSEGGSNVQTRAAKEFEAKTVTTEEELVHSLVAKFEKNTMSYAEQLAGRIVERIGVYEQQLHTELSAMLEQHNLDDVLRKIRRILPVTKTRFKWDSAAQRNVKLLNSRSNSECT
jgi:F-actin capping protein alpha subunit